VRPFRLGVLLIGLGGLLSLTGCAALLSEQRRSESEIQAFADETARVYELPKVELLVNEDVPGTTALYERGRLVVSATLLRSAYRDAVVAHELARYVLRSDAPLRAAGGYERQREHELREMEANAKAVEILMRVKGLGEEQALRATYGLLLAYHRAVQRGVRMLPGHRPPCEEAADLLARFPQYAEWTGSLECAPAALAAEARQRGQREKESREPGRDGSTSDDLVYAYFTDTPIAPGAVYRPGVNMPRGTSEFYVDEDQHLALFMAIKNAHRKVKVASRWLSPDGVQRRLVQSEIDQSDSRGAWTWLSQGNDISDVWLYPGQWEVRVSVDGEEAGTFHFLLHPGAGQAGAPGG
jgi:hypothetical protein